MENEMACIHPTVSETKLNVNGLNNPIKRLRCQTGLKKIQLYLCTRDSLEILKRHSFRIFEDRNRLKVKGWIMICHTNSNEKNLESKKAGVAILKLGKRDFKTKVSVSSNKEGHFIIIRGSIHQENIIIVNIYIPNNRAPTYMKQKWTELKRETDNSIIIVRDINILLSVMHRTTRHKIRQ